MTQAAGSRKVLLPFSDDSTLIFAQRMRDALQGSGLTAETGWLVQGSDLSARQMAALLPGGPDLLLRSTAFAESGALADYDAILTCRMFAPLRDLLRDPVRRHDGRRPAVLAFQGGLDFDPEQGFFNRRHADAVFVVPKSAVAAYRAWAAVKGVQSSQYIGVGHPAFFRPEQSRGGQGDLYFFAQAVSPLTARGRLHLVQVLAALARADPSRTVWLKLRHLPEENRRHLHQELYPYPDLIQRAGAGDLPNLKLTAAPMASVLPEIGIGLTCTSTAAADLIGAGLPTLVYLDYVEAYLDPLVAPMRGLFHKSGVIAPLDDVLHLRWRTPDAVWLSEMFTPREALLQGIFDALAHFAARPDLARRVLPPI